MTPLYLLIALQVADIVTTIIALRGKATESNPVLKKLMDAIGVVPALLLMKGVAIAFFLYVQNAVPVGILWVLCAFYIWVIVNNVKVIRK